MRLKNTSGPGGRRQRPRSLPSGGGRICFSAALRGLPDHKQPARRVLGKDAADGKFGRSAFLGPNAVF